MDGTILTSDSTANGSPVLWTVHVEVRLAPKSRRRVDIIQNLVREFIQSSYERLSLPSVLRGWDVDSVLASSVERIAVAESSCPASSLPLDEVYLQIHAYQPSESDAVEEYANGTGNDGADQVHAASVCELPCKSWEGLWDSLYYPDNIKLKLLDYIHATFVLSDANIDFNLVSWNRVVLLHGPPGTGKTSLCRALAQKLSIRLSHRYTQARLLEINSHSLFSRWFSESGKLVQRLFNNITEMVDDEDCFVVVLIDEVESLTAARAGAMAGTEPSDGLRVVNALLTQLDKLKQRRNVLVMSTSNLAKAIGLSHSKTGFLRLMAGKYVDSAFVDRADIIQYVDLPPRQAIYEILRSALCEFVAKGLLQDVTVPSLEDAMFTEENTWCFDGHASGDTTASLRAEPEKVGRALLRLADMCREQGLSGRALRRLPVLALAQYVGGGVSTSGSTASPGGMSRNGFQADVGVWLDAMNKVVSERTVDRGKLQ
ncbi:P-loop containing nucleoside triphosphate hydrolase protein [Pisolithus albus]|nr:P-loop containing nucleoside triphosphate hydrolase protein [Pisolithus albus]